MSEKRRFDGTVTGIFERDYKDGLGPMVEIESSDLSAAGTWVFPLEWFIKAGYKPDKLQTGVRFKAETATPIGLVPKSWVGIVPTEGEKSVSTD
jgi:hypothetical protein